MTSPAGLDQRGLIVWRRKRILFDKEAGWIIEWQSKDKAGCLASLTAKEGGSKRGEEATFKAPSTSFI